MSNRNFRHCLAVLAAGTLLLFLPAVVGAGAGAGAGAGEPLVIIQQGSLAAGGSILTQPGKFDPYNPMNPAGQSYHGDHAYAFYQVLVDARPLPIVMWHGAGLSSRSWETTADGRGVPRRRSAGADFI